MYDFWIVLFSTQLNFICCLLFCYRQRKISFHFKTDLHEVEWSCNLQFKYQNLITLVFEPHSHVQDSMLFHSSSKREHSPLRRGIVQLLGIYKVNRFFYFVFFFIGGKRIEFKQSFTHQRGRRDETWKLQIAVGYLLRISSL